MYMACMQCLIAAIGFTNEVSVKPPNVNTESGFTLVISSIQGILQVASLLVSYKNNLKILDCVPIKSPFNVTGFLSDKASDYSASQQQILASYSTAMFGDNWSPTS